MGIKQSEYEAYFRMLSENHVDIKHTNSDKHFYRMELDEVLLGTRGGVNSISCVLESYDFNLSDSNSDNVLKKRSGAFMIVGKVSDIGNFTAIAAMRDKCEQIGDDFIKMMYRHKVSKLVPLMRYFDLNTVEAVFVDVKATKEYGMRFSFALESKEGNEIIANKWIDLNKIIIINNDGLVQMDGAFLPGSSRKTGEINNVPGVEYTFNTQSQVEPYDIEISDGNGYVLGIPDQADVQIIHNGITGFYEIKITSDFTDLKLSYKN
jgi:hypothetical protein